MSKYVIDSSTLVGIADAIREKKGTTAPIQVDTFAQQISTIVGSGGVDVKTILEGAKCLDSLNRYGLLDEYYTGNSISLNLAPTFNAASTCFDHSHLCDDITIDIDGTNIGGGSSQLNYFMANCPEIKKLHLTIHDIPSNFRYTLLSYFCQNDDKLEEVNDDVFDFIPTMQAMTQKTNGLFSNCYNLKKLPSSIYRLQIASKSTSMYWDFSNLVNLRRMDIPLNMSTDPSGFMVYKRDFSNLCSLEHFVVTNPNNVQYVGAANSGSNYLTLNLSSYVGYFNGTTYANKVTDIADGTRPRVTNDEEYAMYKNKDYWTTSVVYSHYNKPAAIETLQSLPDMTGWGFNFVVMFQSNSGSKTDGGSIGSMTEEEIAIATDKNWTVQFV